MYSAIVTMPPYAPHLTDVLRHPFVSGIRLNTVMPLAKESPAEVVKRLSHEAGEHGKNLYVDLKTRQLRVRSFGVPPFTEIELTHELTVPTPVTAYFSDGEERAKVLRVDGRKLIMDCGPGRVVGPGESVNIPHPQLRVQGYFTDTDKRYVDACTRAGVHDYLLSFAEGPGDIAELLRRDAHARPVAKIESARGLAYVQTGWKGEARLMAARGDLFVELPPHAINGALETIVEKDPRAIVGSRILESFSRSYEPSCADIGDVGNLLRTGYATFMFGDQICLRKDSIMSGLNLLERLSSEYERQHPAVNHAVLGARS